MRAAVPLVLVQDLAASKDVLAFSTETESAIYRDDANEVLRTTIEAPDGRISVEATFTRIATQKNERVLAERGDSLIVELNALAKQLDPRATTFSTNNEAALRSFAQAIGAPDLEAKEKQLREAIAADGSFGLAYAALAELLARTNPTAVEQVLAQGQQHRGSFTPLDAARFDLLRSRLSQASKADQLRAAESLVRLTPNEPDALATLASGLFAEGRAPEAERLMTRALEISPQNSALRQTLASGLIESSRFTDAEKVLTAMLPNPGVVSQIAFCALFEGDNKRADAVFLKFLSSVSSADAKSFLSASWQALEGRLDEAVRELEAAKFSDARLVTLSRSQIVLWQLMSKQYKAAKETAASANAVAALLASGAPSADAWISKVNVAADAASKESLTAYGLFLLGFYEPAAQAWKEIDMHAGGTDLRARAMLAASLKLAGKTADAAKINVRPFIPDFNDYYSALSFEALRSVMSQAG